MALEFNEKKMRTELLSLYRAFIENPENENIRSDLIKFDRKWGNLATYNDILKSRPIPPYLSKAIGHVSTIFQYGLGTYDDVWIIDVAKDILKRLHKSE
jgi:hypothetical protein